jgi:hypothetical protein
MQALHAEGLDPDDPAVIAAIDLVRWELSLISNGYAIAALIVCSRQQRQQFRRPTGGPVANA